MFSMRVSDVVTVSTRKLLKPHTSGVPLVLPRVEVAEQLSSEARLADEPLGIDIHGAAVELEREVVARVGIHESKEAIGDDGNNDIFRVPTKLHAHGKWIMRIACCLRHERQQLVVIGQPCCTFVTCRSERHHHLGHFDRVREEGRRCPRVLGGPVEAVVDRAAEICQQSRAILAEPIHERWIEKARELRPLVMRTIEVSVCKQIAQPIAHAALGTANDALHLLR